MNYLEDLKKLIKVIFPKYNAKTMLYGLIKNQQKYIICNSFGTKDKLTKIEKHVEFKLI